MKKTIGILVGSLRKESFSLKLAKVVQSMAPAEVVMKIIPIGDLALYNQDFDESDKVPEAYVSFRQQIAALDGVIFVTPEYNRSIPGVLKNALDVGSRPMGHSAWNGKPAVIFSNSPGNLSGFGANHHLRQCLTFLNMPAMPQPEVYIAHVNTLFDDQGNLQDSKTKEFLKGAVKSSMEWINRFQ